MLPFLLLLTIILNFVNPFIGWVIPWYVAFGPLIGILAWCVGRYTWEAVH